MEYIYLYPGSFDPVTYGHYTILTEASKIFPEVIVVCSVNPDKNSRLFTEEECKEMWRTYTLPKNVTVESFSETLQKKYDPNRIVMIRGIRGEMDLDTENRVMLLNSEKYGINKFFYIFSSEKYRGFSSTKVRKLAGELDIEKLSEYVSPLVISKLLEKALGINNLYMVVGKPGSGKSTFLNMLSKINSSNIHINTDKFSDTLEQLVKRSFNDGNLIDLALNNEEKLVRVIGPHWLNLFRDELSYVPQGSNVFVEIPYGMAENKLMFRFAGGKIIYVGCDDTSINSKRTIERGTPELAGFIEKIPGKEKTLELVQKYNLSLKCIETSGDLDKTLNKAYEFNQKIFGGK